jgi:hypothetical protein
LLQVAGYWVLGAGYWLQVTGCGILVIDYSPLNIGF